MRRTLAIAAVALLSIAAVSCKPPVGFVSPCECRGTRDKGRWAAKTDPSLPPTDASAIQAVKPSDILAWAGPTERLTRYSKRIPAEESWYALTGRHRVSLTSPTRARRRQEKGSAETFLHISTRVREAN